jgi:hypothetical protein
MQQLETQIRYQNRILRQVAREGFTAIYEVLLDGGMLVGFEVIRIKVAPVYRMISAKSEIQAALQTAAFTLAHLRIG